MTGIGYHAQCTAEFGNQGHERVGHALCCKGVALAKHQFCAVFGGICSDWICHPRSAMDIPLVSLSESEKFQMVL